MTDDWTPTPENVNALPGPVRRYVHDLETRCDPSGDVQTIASLREQVAGLTARVRELEAEEPCPREFVIVNTRWLNVVAWTVWHWPFRSGRAVYAGPFVAYFKERRRG